MDEQEIVDKMEQAELEAHERALIGERLRAYIYPNIVETPEQETAFDAAVDAQKAHEALQAQALDGVPANVQSFSIGSYSVSKAEADVATYTQATICPAAWALLFNAGLLRRSLPTARRL